MDWVSQLDDEQSDNKSVEITGNNKVTSEVAYEEGRKVKIVRTYKIEKVKVKKEIAKRRTIPKFGLAEGDRPGPNSTTTLMGEEVRMQYLNEKEDESADPNQQGVLNSASNQVVQCRTCGLNHWTLHCPYKNQISALNKTNESDLANGLDSKDKGRGFPSFKDGKRLDPVRGKDENNTIRITNLPEETQDIDIRELFSTFGRINRIFLAKDKITGYSKGFAFVSFETRESAARAIKNVNGHGYMNLILSVEWARPSASS